MADKYCPLMLPVISRDGIPPQCKRERCAWWHAYDRPSRGLPGRCALASIADALTDMDLLGVEIHN